MNGLTDPYDGSTACSRRYAYGHTFRWVKGDRYIAVMSGTCVDGRRHLIIKDNLAGHAVLERPQPLVDAIPVPYGEWADDDVLNLVTDRWAANRRLAR